MSRSFYTPSDWYWIINGNPSQVYSSARWTFVETTDSDYINWSALNTATTISSGSELADVIITQVVPNFLANGVQVNSTGTPSLNGLYPCDANSQSTMTGIIASINAFNEVPGGGSTFMYNGISFTQSQFHSVGQALTNFVYNFSFSVGTYIASEGAEGSISLGPVSIS